MVLCGRDDQATGAIDADLHCSEGMAGQGVAQCFSLEEMIKLQEPSKMIFDILKEWVEGGHGFARGRGVECFERRMG